VPYKFCYRMSRTLDVVLQWTVDVAAGQLHAAVSAPTADGNWLGVGFQSQANFPGMNGSDIVLGYRSAAGQQCVRSMYATRFVGPPDDSTAVKVRIPDALSWSGSNVARSCTTRP
jgi:hypothetical protein